MTLFQTLLFLAVSACAFGASPLTPSPHHTHSHQPEHVQSDKMVMDQTTQDHMDHKDHDHDDMTDHVGMDMNMTHMMQMYFHFGFDEYVLFKEWKISTVGGMLASVFGVFLIGMLYEGLKYFREHLFKKHVSNIQFSTVAITGESGKVTQVHKVERHRMLSFPHAIQTGLHVVQIIVSYFLMLIFMTYNVWLCLAVVLGAGVGYFVFGWKKASVVDITEHCH
ncbi:hypothetical protein JTE90_006951 [Oedothorax gibbosus]|uniref:Copper transport protein n=1 Tax=Oedothorax gibbosus TaxID=931172 RepID=A0AAV6TY98_9ARAC|nr:hypothetical protein JTE90_006951 [Oedothorax gibbosus]